MSRPSRPERALFALFALSALLLASPARAQEADDARSLLDEARFDEALEVLDRVEQRTDLSLADLEQVLELRALAQFALADTTALERALRELAAIAPSHTFVADAPPEVARRFAAIASVAPPLELHLDASIMEDARMLGVHLTGAPDGLVQELELHVDEGLGFVRVATLPHAVRADRDVRAWSRAIGPGGAVLASVGSPAAPRLFGPAAIAPATPAPTEEEEGSGIDPLPFVLVGVGVVVVAVVVTLLVLFVPSGETQPSAPRVVF